jgi:hypothetical protein
VDWTLKTPKDSAFIGVVSVPAGRPIALHLKFPPRSFRGFNAPGDTHFSPLLVTVFLFQFWDLIVIIANHFPTAHIHPLWLFGILEAAQ